MTTIQYIIKDELGIHARPAGLLVKECKKFDSEIKIGCKDKFVDAKRIIGVMGLSVKQDDEITVTFDGVDEKEAAEEIEKFLNANL